MSGVTLNLGEHWLEKQREIAKLSKSLELLQHDLEIQTTLTKKQESIIHNLNEEMENKNSELAAIRTDQEQTTKYVEFVREKAGNLEEEVRKLSSENMSKSEEIEDFRNETDLLKHELDRYMRKASEEEQEIRELEKSNGLLEVRMIEYEKNIKHKDFEINLLEKTKNQKDKHLAILIKEKEKLMKRIKLQACEIPQPTKKIVSKGRVSGLRYNHQLKLLQDLGKENMPQITPIKDSTISSSQTPSVASFSQFKDEIDDEQITGGVNEILLNKKVLNMVTLLAQKDSQIAKLTQENYNLVNRVRNKN